MSNNPIIKQLSNLHEEHQDDMPGGAEKVLSALIQADITESTETFIHFDKTSVLKLSGGASLSDESKRKRVLQLNTFFEKQAEGFKLVSRKNHYILEFPDSLAEKLDQKAFEEFALEIADETDPDDYQPPEVQISRLVFVSHNWRDKATLDISRQFLAELEQQLADRASDVLRIEVFCDLSPNKNFVLHREFQAQQDELCKQAQLCLILWNPGYEKSKACKQELSFFVDEYGNNKPNKAAIAMLERGRKEDIENSKTEQISKRILFNYPHGDDHSLIHFWPDAKPGERYDYVASLIDNIESYFVSPQKDRTKAERIREELIDATDQNVKQGHETDLGDGAHFQDPAGFAGSISGGDRIAIVPHLADWAGSKVGVSVQRVTVLLGDFGFGKTVTCRLLAEFLSKQYKDDQENGILPIYLDLKALLGDLNNNLNQPVEHLLETMLARTGNSTFKGIDIVHYIKTQKCLVIFDGFDEIGHKLNASQQQAMYHKLLNIVPEQVFKNDLRHTDHIKWNAELAKFPSKLLVSCRTHFFNHVAHEKSFLTGNQRHVISGSNIRRFYMAPFNEEAIKNYLIDALGNLEGDAAYHMLGDIHDLSDLSKHPILLKLISQQIPFLQEMIAQNQTVNSAILYRQMFDAIGERDTDKHIIKLSRKQKLLANLAFDLWLQGKTQLDFERLEDWFIDYSCGEKLLNRQISGNTEVFDSMVRDLCNATLLVRDAEDKYRFAHTSYLEFFRALGIFEFIRSGNALENNPLHNNSAFHSLNKLPELNDETLQFIINWWQVCKEEDRKEFDTRFVHLLESPLNQHSKWLGFYIWRYALQSIGHPRISRFPHSSATDWSTLEFGEDFISKKTLENIFDISEKAPTHIDFSYANFSKCHFLNTYFFKLKLKNTNFMQSKINQCYFFDVEVSDVTFKNCELIHSNPPVYFN